MSSKSLVRRLVRRLVAPAAVLALAPTPGSPASRTYALASVSAKTLERARAGAALKLESAECQALLREFKDGNGRPLAETLARFDRSPADYLRMIPFLDGSSHPLCRGGRAELFAQTGIPRVFVCRSFVEKQIGDPWTAENMVIHEMLHTLGLGENPPSSGEITRRVNSRCQ
jgi:hypothetical protein